MARYRVIVGLALLLAGAGPAEAGDVFAGRPIYEAHCANCHGVDGKPTVPGTPDFTRGEGLLVPDPMLIRSIKSGKQLMPGFDRIISERDILNVLSYVRTLQW